jgi:hypothetical protein
MNNNSKDNSRLNTTTVVPQPRGRRDKGRKRRAEGDGTRAQIDYDELSSSHRIVRLIRSGKTVKCFFETIDIIDATGIREKDKQQFSLINAIKMFNGVSGKSDVLKMSIQYLPSNVSGQKACFFTAAITGTKEKGVLSFKNKHLASSVFTRWVQRVDKKSIQDGLALSVDKHGTTGNIGIFSVITSFSVDFNNEDDLKAMITSFKSKF